MDRWKYEYNPQKAEQLLQSLGFTKGADGIYVTPNGTRLEFTLALDGWMKPETVEALSTQLAKVGIKINVRIYETGAYYGEDGVFNTMQFDIGVIPHASPGFSFANTLVTQRMRWILHGKQNYPDIWDTPWGSVNITALSEKLREPIPEAEYHNIVSILSYVEGENLLWIPLFTRPVIILLNKQKFTGWPKDMGYWQGLASYAARGLSYLFRWHKIIPLLKLTIEATEGGTTNPAPGTYTYRKGEKVTVTAVPSEGYDFEKWVLDGKDYSTNPTVEITMDTHHTLKAVFKSKPPIMLYIGIIVIIIIIIGAIYYVYKKKK